MIVLLPVLTGLTISTQAGGWGGFVFLASACIARDGGVLLRAFGVGARLLAWAGGLEARGPVTLLIFGAGGFSFGWGDRAVCVLRRGGFHAPFDAHTLDFTDVTPFFVPWIRRSSLNVVLG